MHTFDDKMDFDVSKTFFGRIHEKGQAVERSIETTVRLGVYNLGSLTYCKHNLSIYFTTKVIRV